MSTPPDRRLAGPADGPRLGPIALGAYNVAYWPYLLASLPVLFVPALGIWAATAPFDGRRRVHHWYTSLWGAHYLAWAPFAGVTVEGREQVENRGPFIYVSNHQSMVDILAVFATHLDYLWVSKVENFYVPFLGWNMWMGRYVPLKRGYLPSIMRMYRTCIRRLAEGHSLFIFPEGTRSPDGEIKSFFPGAFRLAVRSRVSVVPIVIDGTAEVLPKKSFRITPRNVRIRILEPVRPQDHGGDHRRLRDAVRADMIRELDRMRGRRPDDAAQAGASVPIATGP